ncbi:hypothetical protein MMC09_005020 [Bachmanniomyces sp. S44760]|nr:hypothetical protein [Bachmanniomyces sp. S44760]
MVATLLTLPDEVLCSIIGHFVDPTVEVLAFTEYCAEKITLLNIMRTCRRLWRLTEPFLYARITFYDLARTYIGSFQNLASFTSCMLKDAQKASYVREVSSIFRVQESPRVELKGPWGEEFDRAIEQATANDNEQARWKDDVNDGSSDAFMALILLACEGIQRLRLAVAPLPGPNRMMERVLQSLETSTGRSALPSLKVITLSFTTDEATLEYLVPLLKLESLQELKFSGTVGGSEVTFAPQSSFWNFKHRGSALKRLDIQGCCFNPRVIRDIAKVLKSPKIYSYHHASRSRHSSILDLEAHSEAIMMFKDSLETLYLDFQRIHEPIMGLEIGPLICSLADFPKLKSITARVSCLINSWTNTMALSEILPSSIEKLGLINHHLNIAPRMSDQVLELIKVKNIRFPNLSNINVEWFDFEYKVAHEELLLELEGRKGVSPSTIATDDNSHNSHMARSKVSNLLALAKANEVDLQPWIPD